MQENLNDLYDYTRQTLTLRETLTPVTKCIKHMIGTEVLGDQLLEEARKLKFRDDINPDDWYCVRYPSYLPPIYLRILQLRDTSKPYQLRHQDLTSFTKDECRLWREAVTYRTNQCIENSIHDLTVNEIDGNNDLTAIIQQSLGTIRVIDRSEVSGLELVMVPMESYEAVGTVGMDLLSERYGHEAAVDFLKQYRELRGLFTLDCRPIAIDPTYDTAVRKDANNWLSCTTNSAFKLDAIQTIIRKVMESYKNRNKCIMLP